MTLLDAGPSCLLGVQLPRIHSVPEYSYSQGMLAIDLAFMAGLELDEWQQLVLIDSLGVRPDGKWAAFEVGEVISRQNGKGGTLEARELAGLFLFEERLLIHSAHMFDTSIEHFGRLLSLIEETPELSKRIAKRGVSHAHGNEGIKLKSGQRIRFRTRTKGGGRGFTADLLVLDEAMDIPEATHGALLPTLSARPNPQVWYTGSAVDEEVDDNGVVFARVRERGLKGDSPRLAFFEWSAPLELDKVTPDEADNEDNWAAANPALGIRISPEHVANERASMSTRKFAVERLGVGAWPRTDEAADRMISNEAWAACIDLESDVLNPVCFAFDVSPDRSSASIAVAGDRGDGLQHVEVVEQRRGTGWLLDRLIGLAKAHRPYLILLDGYGPAGSLVAELEDEVGRNRKGKSILLATTTREYGQACGGFYDAVVDRTLRHLGTQEMKAAIDGAKTRPMGEAWKWSRSSSEVDITPLVSCTLALYGNSRRPKKRARVINLNDV